MSKAFTEQLILVEESPVKGIKYYYVLYLTYKGANEIRLREFDTKEEAKAFQKQCDEQFAKRGQFKFSKIMKRDMRKHDTEYWL